MYQLTRQCPDVTIGRHDLGHTADVGCDDGLTLE
jgi:hypothetical protein